MLQRMRRALDMRGLSDVVITLLRGLIQTVENALEIDCGAVQLRIYCGTVRPQTVGNA